MFGKSVNNLNNSILVLMMAMVFSLVGCGGGGGGSPAAIVPATTLSGTAAAGAPIIGTVTVKGALGKTTSALIEANGNYNVDVTGLTAPYRLRAQGTVGGRTYKLHSYAVESDLGNTVNITPFTDLIVANAAQQIAESYFDSNTPVELTPTEIDAQETALQAKLQDVLTALGVADAIDLLNTTFSADHSGLDAALDIVSVEVDALTNIATITSLLEPANVITDDILDSTDNAVTLTVTDAAVLTAAVTDTQAIVAAFDGFAAAFASGLPTGTALTTVTAFFADDFLLGDQGKSLLITDISTDPGFIGLEFGGLTVNNIDAVAGTAEVTFNFGINGIFELESETWFVAKNAISGEWQARGDQRIVETDFSYHCNDGDGAENLIGTSTWSGACGINTQFWDEDFTNNGTADAPIASGTVKIIDAITSAVKATVYLGTPVAGTAGDVQVYNEEFGNYQGDWRAFGVGVGQINSAVFAVGDTIEYTLYTADLDITVLASPTIVGVPVATYTDTVQFVPEVTLSKIPSATAATLTAMSNFTLGNNLTIGWTLVAGTRNNEILVEISDSAGNRIEIWDYNFGTTATSKTYSSIQLDATAASAAGLLATDATYNLKVRIYAADELTGQSHSIDYDVSIPGPASVPPVSSLVCGYESGWDDLANGGLGAPITPNSFVDYETVLADCGTAMSFTVADVAGTVFVDAGETMTFNDTAAAGTVADPETGVFDDGTGVTTNLIWYVEAATCTSCTHSYVVAYTDETIEPGLPAGFSFRETSALMAITGTPGVAGANYSFDKYSEQSNYGDMVRATGTDGEIWSSPNNILQ